MGFSIIFIRIHMDTFHNLSFWENIHPEPKFLGFFSIACGAPHGDAVHQGATRGCLTAARRAELPKTRDMERPNRSAAGPWRATWQSSVKFQSAFLRCQPDQTQREKIPNQGRLPLKEETCMFSKRTLYYVVK